MRKCFFLFALLLSVLTAGAQKMVVHMAGNQTVEFDAMQLDSINFIEVDNPGIDPDTDPSVTGDAIDVTSKSATLVGYATSIRDNLSTDLRVGFIYCQKGTPSKSNGTQVDVSVNSVAADGRYTKTIGNLLYDATYYYRSFVYQSGLWFYGKVKSFTTQGINVNFTTGEATAITCFSAKVSGSVDVQSSYSSLTYGICYGTSIEPTTSDKTLQASSGSFTLHLRQLLGGTSYYYRPYAIVDGQTLYGSAHTFRTLDDNVVETGTIDEETLTVTSRLTIGGGAYSTLALGVCYGKTELPTINDKIVTSNEVDEENNYTVKLVDPDYGTIYYRAYILIDNVPHYGAVRSFEQESYVQTYTVNGVSFKMIPVEGGTFQMGSDDSDAYSNEQPVHQVTVSSFSIGETEVTQELWEAVMGSNPSDFKGSKLPVEKVSWYDCQTFIGKLNELTGKTFRLPTEAEWEYAARGGNKSNGYTYSGSNTIGDVAWCSSNSSSSTDPVATKAPNELGIYDMSGNVNEWCQDWYSSSYSSGSQTNPSGPSSGFNRVTRGGSWYIIARRCRVSYRLYGDPTNSWGDCGLRLTQ